MPHNIGFISCHTAQYVPLQAPDEKLIDIFGMHYKANFPKFDVYFDLITHRPPRCTNAHGQYIERQRPERVLHHALAYEQRILIVHHSSEFCVCVPGFYSNRTLNLSEFRSAHS
ncbi:hypothetical protein PISMIDRAFT_679666 [Pisolithus microcarpus 441]|uniref:Uncharacterized protein n=1 Tax=Pisolithus microcarpus 441 TaxID=765257 RepID=A0A0C9ZKX8_9AGAM|nr:hypothetical protein PISMIDRAFT_679666 [Pisolithus microcarpus 441]